jgi:hypothetical protein
MKELEYDRLTLDERVSLDAGRSVRILNELIGEIHDLSKSKCDAIESRKRARLSAMVRIPKWRDDPAVVEAQATIDVLSEWMRTRRDQKSVFQTQLRSLLI